MNGKRKADEVDKSVQKDLPSSKRLETETNGGATPIPNATRPISSTIPVEAHHSVLPLSMKLMRPFWSVNCDNCDPRKKSTPISSTYNQGVGPRFHPMSTPSFIGKSGEMVNPEQQYCSYIWEGNEVNSSTRDIQPTRSTDSASETQDMVIHSNSDDTGLRQRRGTQRNEDDALTNGQEEIETRRKSHVETIHPSPRSHTLPIIQEYITATQMYGCTQVNSGVLTTLRFGLPTMRVAEFFHDADMLALSEVLFRHCNGALRHISRLDFSIAARFGKLHGRKGFGSHGAFTLSRVLYISKYIEEVFVQRNRIGPYGASAIFAACAKNPTIKVVEMRRCGIGEKGALAFVEHIGNSDHCGLKDVDLSVNKIGFRGSIMMEEMLMEKERRGRPIDVDLEGNLVLQEIMNGVTHGLGVILCIVGAAMLHQKTRRACLNVRLSCTVYSISLLVLYISSTLYHSFFALKYTRYIFECLDHCAIYILITGSYIPFLRIALHDKPLGSFYLLIFNCLCCMGGVYVEACHNTWIYKPKFSLAMYLGMGWSCMLCMPDMMEVLPQEAINLIILGGIGYTSGVPFFVRNNNLDHSIWHCFVLAGSVFHWFCVYLYVAKMNK